MQALSDYNFHKSEHKKETYFGHKNIWWSSELKKWMCTNPNIIKGILTDERFCVHSYQIKALEEKTHAKFSHISEIIHYFPLALEGDTHKELRKKGALSLAERINSTLDLFTTEIGAKIDLIEHRNAEINFYSEIIEPCIKRALLHLADLDSLANESIISISQLFDQAISIKKRIRINDQIAELLHLLPDNMPADEKYFKLSIFAVGYDSLLGSFTESLVRTLLQNENKKINQISWTDELSNTGVPVIERIAVQDLELDGADIKKGQKIRLYLESAGFVSSENSVYTQLFFGNGIHKCIGLHLSNAMWKVFVHKLSKVERYFEIKHLHYRTEDYVFNIFDEIEVSFNDK